MHAAQIDRNTKVTDLRKAPGLDDLPTLVAGKFALALKAEAVGDFEKAENLLNEAIAAEEKLVTG